MEVIIKTIAAVILVIFIGNSIFVHLVRTIILADRVEIPRGAIKIVKIIDNMSFEKSLIVTYNLTYYIDGSILLILSRPKILELCFLISGGFLE